ncbi:hypothetical protein NtRootA9_29190 [Arthrobacter sp. NtRootA9]|nr:hypothetical protein NtRootA9_29190 [Arthrobacter sp. NtRootA9]
MAPSLANGEPNFAFSATYTTSVASSSPSPTPKQAPCAAADVGAGNAAICFNSVSHGRLRRLTRSPQRSPMISVSISNGIAEAVLDAPQSLNSQDEQALVIWQGLRRRCCRRRTR